MNILPVSGAAEATMSPGEGRRRLKDHQIRAVRAAADHYRRNDRGQLILPCGTGKTAVAATIREELAPGATLVLLPSLALVGQFRDEWAAWRSTPYESLCVCSDADTAGDEDAPGMDTLGLRGDASTDPAVVARFLRRPGPKVVFSTYQSLESVCIGARKAAAAFDLAVCDEAHRTAGCGMRLFGNVHHDARVKARKRLYMTATPRIATSAYGTAGGSVVYDMDDQAVFGRPFFQMTFRQAIDAKLLAAYEVVAIGVADDEVRRWMRESAQCGDCGSVADLAMNYALDLAMRRHGARRAISYHSRVRSAAEFARRHGRLFDDVFSGHVSGAQSVGVRGENISRFRSSPRALLSNVRCLVEGFDVPAVDMVFFCDPKCSEIDVVQAVGRALRLDPARPDKKGLVVLPVFHASTQDLDDGLADAGFRNVARVLRTLSKVDDVLRGAISIRGTKGSGFPVMSDVDPTAEPPAEHAEDAKVVLSGFDDRLGKALFEQVVGAEDEAPDGWQLAYRSMTRFRNANPERWPARGEECPEGIDLWKWRKAQLRAQRSGTLTNDRRRLLGECGLLDGARPSWLVQYQRLRSWVAANPGRWPAKADEYPEGNRIGAWCAAQRHTRRKGELSADRIRLLDGLKFPWGRVVSDLSSRVPVSSHAGM
jgi:superfamily II DNA or RNA helicase